MHAPVALFVYNRPWHTQQTVEALLKNAEAVDSDLIVFSDGAKDEASREKVDEVRQYIHSIKGFKSIRIVEREENLGLAQSIISGVTEVVNEHGRVIVLEDDMVTSPYFLKYMNDALILYENDDRVISIHGYNYPIEEPLPAAFFLKGADCWGWATWKRGWDLFEADGRKLLAELTQRNLVDRFDFFGGFDYSGMLKAQIEGRNDSWAVRWYASALLHDKLTLYPGKSLVHNTGNDASGRHCGAIRVFDSDLSLDPVSVGGIEVEENSDVLMAVSRFLRQAKPNIPARIRNKVKRTVRSLVSK